MSLRDQSLNIKTQYGPIKGCKKESILGRDYYSFQRIPYMKAPVGKLRFTDPQPPEKWAEPLDCTKDGPPFCNMNFFNNQYEGQLDGVHINVFTPNFEPEKPVLFWIHGGGIYTGNASETVCGPDYFMQKDVVLVTFQYRIGVFGFLSLNDPSLNIPGNAQFRDHIMALKWVQSNIEQFGGDKNNVTVFGESWGGGSTSYLMLSDKSEGLFHRGILMSGTALNNAYTYFPPRNYAVRLALKLGYAGPHDDKSILEFLENADEKELVIASGHILTDREKNEEGYICPFGPVIEPFDNGNAFITDKIIEMMKKSWGNDIDILVGNTSNECLSLYAMIKTEEALNTVKHFTKYVPRELELPLDSDKINECAEILKRHYYGALEPTLTNMEGICQVSNDGILWHPMYRFNMIRLAHGKAKTYNYRFDYVTENNLFRKKFQIDEKFPEAVHGDDIWYYFRGQEMEGENFNLSLNSKGFEGIKLMVSIITEFARTGDPNVPLLNDVKWTPATLEQPLYGLNLSEKGSKMIEFPEYRRFKVFDQFFHSGGTTHL